MGFEAGAGEFMQDGSYSAPQMRRSVFAWAARTSANVEGEIVGGLLSASDMQLSAASSGLVVNVSTGACLIPGTEATSQGGYHGFVESTGSVTLATANATNPRIDLICATSGDASYSLPPGGTSGAVTLQAVTGTPTSGATLTNLSGAPSLPKSSLLLGYVLVSAAATSLTSGDIVNAAVQLALGLDFVDSGWRTPDFTNSWGYYAGQANKGYRRAGNTLYVNMTICGGSSGTKAFSLSNEFSPTGTGNNIITGLGQGPTGYAALAFPGGGGDVYLYVNDDGGSPGYWGFNTAIRLD